MAQGARWLCSLVLVSTMGAGLAWGPPCLAGDLRLDSGGVSFAIPAPAQPAAVEPLSVRCVPMQFLDGVFAMSRGDPSLLRFGLRALEGAPAPRGARLFVSVPRGVSFVAWAPEIRMTQAKPPEDGDGPTVYEFGLPDLAPLIGPDHASGPGACLLAELDQSAPSDLGEIEYWLEFETRPGRPRTRTEPMRLKLLSLPRIQARAPRDFAAGVMLRAPSRSLGDTPGVRRYAEFIRRCGVTWLPAAARTGAGEFCRELGLTVLDGDGLRDGFLWKTLAMPQAWAFIQASGKPFPKAVCPTAIHRRLGFYANNIFRDFIRQRLVVESSASGFNAVWDPRAFLGKGCFCDRCRAEFAAHSKLPAQDVAAAWPRDIVARFPAEWARFWAWQHGRVVATLDWDARQAGAEAGLRGFYVPEIPASAFAPGAEPDPKEYMSEISHCASWGGFWSFDYLSPGAPPGAEVRLAMARHAEAFRTWVDANCPQGKRPRLHWLFQGYQGERRVTFPEAVGFDLLCGLVAGLDGAWACGFPMGYDNRYWQSLAQAVDTAADFDRYTREGARERRHAAEPLTPMPQAEAGPLLRTWEFRLGDRRLFAAGNFWTDGEAFFRLKVQGLDPGQSYSLSEPRAGRVYVAPSGRQEWTAQELESGALLHAGALRWAFFELVPAGGAAGHVVRVEDMTREMESRFEAIRLASERTARAAAAPAAEETPGVE